MRTIAEDLFADLFPTDTALHGYAASGGSISESLAAITKVITRWFGLYGDALLYESVVHWLSLHEGAFLLESIIRHECKTRTSLYYPCLLLLIE